MPSSKVFTIVVRVRGKLASSFVFENQQECDNWVQDGFGKLQRKYGNLTVSFDILPGLNIGDECNVCGEGSDVFVIRDLIKIEDHRWSFVLDSGCREEVAKCHTDYLNHFYDGGDDAEEDDDGFGF